MITIKSAASIEKMQIAGGIVRDTLALMQDLVKPGVSTAYLDREAEEFIRSKGAIPSFLNYQGYPKSICVSINDQVVHGIPGNRVIREGDIVSVDVGACIHGYHGDAARTFFAGEVSEEAKRLVRITKESFFEGLKYAREGHFLSEVSAAIQKYAEDAGYSVVRELIGHGIGRNMHEDPEVPNYHDPRRGRGPRLREGMTIAIEPMINLGGKEITYSADEWTVCTRDGSLSAHYENTIAITKGDPLILTMAEEDR
ncbi:MAG: type I methionyl aminopeptidase [Clostridia bacterium]|nr:type I methionyl aminopeptidase [Clostridia bacterium]